MTQLPAGTLTFLFTDIEGSTRLWEADPDRMRVALARHDEAIERAVVANGGAVFKHTGDGVCAVFTSAPRAVEAAVAAQQALGSGDLRARMGLHTGQAEPIGDDYFGTPLNRCARIMGAAHGGQIVCSATTAAIAQDDPRVKLRDLGAHRLRDLGEPQHLFQVVHADLPDLFPPLRALDAHRHNLPIPRTTFVGRTRELGELTGALLASRIVTVTGVGGSGKTRLAIQAAADVVHQFADGVALAELATVSDPAELPARLAEAIGVPLSGVSRSPRALLAEYVDGKELLIVLDNCEHLLDGCAELVDELLSVSDRVTVMATSREPLGVSGERVLRIPSLEVSTDESSVEAVLTSEAGQLFHDRAAMVRADFAVTQATVEAVAQICRRLDGIPLAIELAAARLRHLSVQQLAERLDDRFRVLTGGGRTALPRQQTLQATLDWSHDLLSEPERILFRRLSVFVGSFPLEAVEGVCSGEGIDSVDVLDLLGRLVDRSLVALEDAADPLYRMLETMRHFAQQKLIDADEAARLRDRHRDWYAACLDTGSMAAAVYGIVPIPTHVQENMRAALEWATDTTADDAAHRLMAQAAQNWISRGFLDEGAHWLDVVLARPFSDAVVEERAWALIAASIYANMRNQFARGFELAEVAQRFVIEHSLQRLEPQVFEAMAIAASVSRSIIEGEVLMERAASTARELGFTRLAGATSAQLAGLRLTHDPEAACIAAEQAVVSLPDETDDLGLAWATLAFARLVAGDEAGSAVAVEATGRLIGKSDAWAGIETILARAPALAAQGRADDARRELQTALTAIRQVRVPLAETAYLIGFAAVEAFGGDPRLALVLLGAARRRFDDEHAWRAPIVSALYVHSQARARALLPTDVAKAAREEGMGLAGDEVFALIDN